MLDIKRNSIVNNTINLTLSKIITLSIAMISSMLLSRFRTLNEYGTYSQLMMAINLTTSILMLGLPNSINYFLARADTTLEGRKFLNTYYTFSTILSIIVGFILVYIAPLIAKYFENEYIMSFIYFFAIFPWSKVINSSIENILIVYQKTKVLAIYRILNSISLLGIILVVQVLSLRFDTYMFLFLCIESIFAIIVYVLVKKYSGELKFSIDIKMMKQILKFSIPIGLASVVGTLNTELDKLVIGRFLDTSQLAIYANAGREMPVTIIATSITAVLLPQITRLLKYNRNEEAISLWGKATSVSYAIICFLAIGLIVFAPEVIIILYSEKYLEGVGIFRIYNMLLILRCTYFGMILNAKGKTKFILYSSILSLILNIILNYICLIVFGFIGPAIATLISQLVINIMQLVHTSKTMNISFNKVFPWNELMKISVINIVLGICFFSIKNILKIDIVIGNILESIILGILWGYIYLLYMKKNIKKQWDELKKGELVC